MAKTLEPDIQEILLGEAKLLLDRLHDPEQRRPYEQLVAAINAGEVPDEQAEALGNLLELSLSSGRVRKLHGLHAENALVRLYHTTPRGAGIVQATRDVNAALESLRRHTVEEISFSPKGPGDYRIVISTDQCQLTIETGREGVWVKDMSVGV